MATIIPQPDLQQDCLAKLSRALDLVLKTAEAASADNNHKVVIQSAREVARLAALIHKMTGSTTKPGRATQAGLPGAKISNPRAPGRKTSSRPQPTGKAQPAGGQTDINPDDLIMPDLETLFTPDDMAFWHGLPDNIFQKFSENYRELQSLGQELAADLPAANQAGGAAE